MFISYVYQRNNIWMSLRCETSESRDGHSFAAVSGWIRCKSHMASMMESPLLLELFSHNSKRCAKMNEITWNKTDNQVSAWRPSQVKSSVLALSSLTHCASLSVWKQSSQQEISWPFIVEEVKIRWHQYDQSIHILLLRIRILDFNVSIVDVTHCPRGGR